MVQPITLYDIPSTVPGKCWSVNIWKARYALNLKKIPYSTTWVEYPDIAPLSAKLGIQPTNVGPSGYTLPAIFDPNPSTPVALADSILIAKYLDSAYPSNTPTLFPAGSHALQHMFIDFIADKFKPLPAFAFPAYPNFLNPPSLEYFRRTREPRFGCKLEDIAPKGDKAVEEWAKIKEAFDLVDGWLSKGEGPWFMGKELVFVDVFIAGSLKYFKIIWGEDSWQWKDISSWNGGRWKRWLDEFEKYASTD